MGARLLITGSREWTDRDVLERALTDAQAKLAELGEITLVSGHCPTGADAMAEVFWNRAGLPVETHPVTPNQWRTIGAKAGPLRNKKMAELGADLCLGFVLDGTDPKTGKPLSRGTRGAIALAQKAGIPTLVYAQEA